MITEEQLTAMKTKIKKTEELLSSICWCKECVGVLQGATSRIDMVFVRGGFPPHITIPDGLKIEFLDKMLSHFYQEIAKYEKELVELS